MFRSIVFEFMHFQCFILVNIFILLIFVTILYRQFIRGCVDNYAWIGRAIVEFRDLSVKQD